MRKFDSQNFNFKYLLLKLPMNEKLNDILEKGIHQVSTGKVR